MPGNHETDKSHVLGAFLRTTWGLLLLVALAGAAAHFRFTTANEVLTVATVALVWVTWRYAESTAVIADATRAASRHAWRSAEAVLQQTQIQARPQLRIVAFDPRMKASRDTDALGGKAEAFTFPWRLEFTASNDGPGPANNILCEVTVAGVGFETNVYGAHLALPMVATEPTTFVATCPTDRLTQLATNYGLARREPQSGADRRAVGLVSIRCDDGISQRVEFGWELWAGRDEADDDRPELGYIRIEVVDSRESDGTPSTTPRQAEGLTS